MGKARLHVRDVAHISGDAGWLRPGRQLPAIHG